MPGRLRGRGVEVIIDQFHAVEAAFVECRDQGIRQSGSALVGGRIGQFRVVCRRGIACFAHGIRHFPAHAEHRHLRPFLLPLLYHHRRFPDHRRVESTAQRRVRAERHHCHTFRPVCLLPLLRRELGNMLIRGNILPGRLCPYLVDKFCILPCCRLILRSISPIFLRRGISLLHGTGRLL